MYYLRPGGHDSHDPDELEARLCSPFLVPPNHFHPLHYTAINQVREAIRISHPSSSMEALDTLK